MRSQVTTGRGDEGYTVAISGDRLSKSDPVMECCGCVDALLAHTALVRVLIQESGREDAKQLSETLYWLLHVYFLMGTECNDPSAKRPEYRKGTVSPEHLKRLEAWQAELEAVLNLPKAFVVSASNPLSAQVDIACTAARSAERSIVRLKEAVPEFQAQDILAFVNRLSDFLYILARHLEDGRYQVVDYSIFDETD